MTAHLCRVCGQVETVALFCAACRDRALAHLGWTVNDLDTMEDVMLVYSYANRLHRGELAPEE